MHLNGVRYAYLIMVLGGVIFPFICVDQSRKRSRWGKCIFVITGLLCVFIGLEKLAHSLHWIQFATEASLRQEKVIMLGCMGFTVGMFFTLIVSGELFGKKISSPSKGETTGPRPG